MNPFEVKAYWVQIEGNSPLRTVNAYGPVLHIPSQYTGYVWNVASLLADTGHPMEALSLRAYLVEHYRQSGDQGNLAGALGNQALILRARGDLDGAMALHQEQERLCRELGSKDGLARSLANQALLLAQEMGRSREALPLAEEAYLLANAPTGSPRWRSRSSPSWTLCGQAENSPQLQQ